jgi:hypothetical protein
MIITLNYKTFKRIFKIIIHKLKIKLFNTTIFIYKKVILFLTLLLQF